MSTTLQEQIDKLKLDISVERKMIQMLVDLIKVDHPEIIESWLQEMQKLEKDQKAKYNGVPSPMYRLALGLRPRWKAVLGYKE